MGRGEKKYVVGRICEFIGEKGLNMCFERVTYAVKIVYVEMEDDMVWKNT